MCAEFFKKAQKARRYLFFEFFVCGTILLLFIRVFVVMHIISCHENKIIVTVTAYKAEKRHKVHILYLLLQLAFNRMSNK